MTDCNRCGKQFCESFLDREFCKECGDEFAELIRELKVGFIADWNEENLKEKV